MSQGNTVCWKTEVDIEKLKKSFEGGEWMMKETAMALSLGRVITFDL